MLGDLVICVRIKGFCYLYKYIKLLGFFYFYMYRWVYV